MRPLRDVRLLPVRLSPGVDAASRDGSPGRLAGSAMTADEMREAGANLTREQAETIAAKFCTEIGTVYEVVAAAILQQHGFTS